MQQPTQALSSNRPHSLLVYRAPGAWRLVRRAPQPHAQPTSDVVALANPQNKSPCKAQAWGGEALCHGSQGMASTTQFAATTRQADRGGQRRGVALEQPCVDLAPPRTMQTSPHSSAVQKNSV